MRTNATPALFSLIQNIFGRVISFADWGYSIFKPVLQITSGMPLELDSELKVEKNDFCDDGATEVDSSWSSPCTSPESVLYPSKQVRFSLKVKVVLIPCVNEYKEAGVHEAIWYSSNEMKGMVDEFIHERAPFLDAQKDVGQHGDIKIYRQAANKYIKCLFWQHNDCKSEQIMEDEYSTLERNTLFNKTDLKLN